MIKGNKRGNLNGARKIRNITGAYQVNRNEEMKKITE